MIEETVAGTTAAIKTDYRFSELLAEDFGIDGVTIRQALIREPQKQAIAICEWAAGTDNPAQALTNWAKKHRRGDFAPRRPNRRHQENNPIWGAALRSGYFDTTD